jgi:hypothetical protein
MKPLTKIQKQWLWFAGLWCSGLASMLVLAALIRWMMGLS